MKRITPILLCLMLGSASAAFADEMTEVYKMIYMEAEGLPQKYAATLNLISLEDRSIAPVLAEALEELVRTQKNYVAASEKELFARTVRILTQAIGNYKYDDAAATLWVVVEQVPDPLAKSEAIVALGKMRALDYAERIAILLRDLNMKSTSDLDYGEKMAYGAILALDKLKDPRGFSPVFFATDSWYSQRVKQQAERSLLNIVNDPTDAIKEILANESAERKVKALKAEMASKASLERKIEASLLALELGHLKVSLDRAEARVMADLRKLALTNLITLKAKGPDPVEGCQQSYEKGFDDQERLLGLAALGSNGADPAAIVLRDIILKLNSEQRAGLSSDARNLMVKAAIENAGATRNKLVKAALVSVAANDKWSGGIILAAQNASKAIP